MVKSDLGRLEHVDLRTVWLSEANDFTPWLAQEENLALLSDIIGLNLAWDATEKNVGPFRADILCRDTTTGHYVLIENQLERTDHTHLGQLLTYAAGLKAVTIVWVAKHITEEHRAALDWLNEVTAEGVNFFGLEIELWRIGKSPAAPKFNVVCQPNDWSKRFNPTPGSLGGLGAFYMDYWTALKAYMDANPGQVKARRPSTQNWAAFAVGHSGFSLQIWLHMDENKLDVSLAITNSLAKPWFHLLSKQKAEIQSALGELNWHELPDKKWCYISQYHPADIRKQETWAEQFKWLQQRLDAFHTTFAPLIQKFKYSVQSANVDYPNAVAVDGDNSPQ